MSSESLSVQIVRDRPVGYVPGPFGGSLVAVERGYFPISHSGYRSLARGIEFENAPAPSLEFLEDLALENDRVTADVLRRARKTLAMTTSNGLAYFDLHLTVDHGFFATDSDRIQLWRTAYRLADRILRDENLQPNARTLPAWSRETCDRTMERTRITLAWLRQLLAGDVASPPEGLRPCFGAYWELPIRSTPEPVIGLPEIATELSLDLPTAGDLEDEIFEEDEDVDEYSDEDDSAEDAGHDRELEPSPAPAEADSQQLALF